MRARSRYLNGGLDVYVLNEEAQGPKIRVVHRFATVKQAEDWIAARARLEPAKVARGGYIVGGPEDAAK